MNQATKQTSNPQTLKGWVSTTFTRYRGKRLGPYYARHWKAKGKLRTQYIKPADVECVLAACQAHRDERKKERATDQHLTTLLGNLNYLTRMEKRAKKNQLTSADHDHLDRIATSGPLPKAAQNSEDKRVLCIPFLLIIFFVIPSGAERSGVEGPDRKHHTLAESGITSSQIPRSSR
jgi:hypothetical protein